jgi:DNA (cytosine-5)-methyltransferase 1
VPLSVKRKLEGLKDGQIGCRWRTVRDAISGLSLPARGKNSDLPNHLFVPGARSYPGHTGSELDLPAKTLKAGVHGVPGGENMLRYVNGKVRYFSVREQARLQTFPDDFEIHGTWTSTTRQLGNAVPVELARVVATSLSTLLSATN